MADTPYPDAPGESGSTANIHQALGIGNYTIADNTDGSGTNFGQTIDATFVRSLIPGAAPTLLGGGLWTSIADFRDKMHGYLSGFDLETLKTVQPFIPGATDDDFVDSETAATKIMDKFGLHYKLATDDFDGWLQTIFNPNGDRWNNAKDWWDQLLARLHHDDGSGVTDGDEAGGILEQARSNWQDYLTNRGILHAADAGERAALNDAWQTRKDDNDEIIRDLFHNTYPKGTVTDTAATLVGGLRTWWGAVNDNKLIRKERLGLSALPTTATADVGGALDTHTTAIAANSTSIQATNDAVVVGATGQTSTGATDTDVQTAINGLQTTVTGLQTVIQANAADADVRQRLADDFATNTGGANNVWGPAWTSIVGTGSSFVNPMSVLVWTASPSTYLQGAFNLTTTADRQIIKAVLASTPTANGYNYLVGRRKADWSQYVACKIGKNTLSIVYVNGGSEVSLQSTSYSTAAGAPVMFELGTSNGTTEYAVTVNGVNLLRVTSSSPAVGSSNRGSGLYLVNGATPGPPGNMTYFEVSDGTPNTVPGSGFRAYRNSTTSAGNVTTVMPNGYYDSVDYISADIGFVAPELTLNTAGVYLVTFDVQVQGTNYGSGVGTAFPCVFVKLPGGSYVQVADGWEIDAGSVRDIHMSTLLNITAAGTCIQVAASFPGSTAVGRRTGFPPPQFVVQKVA